MVQRRAARFVVRNYSRTASVTNMLVKLRWKTLEERRKNARLETFYKIINNQVEIPMSLQRNTYTHSENSQTFRVPLAKHDFYKNSLFSNVCCSSMCFLYIFLEDRWQKNKFMNIINIFRCYFTVCIMYQCVLKRFVFEKCFVYIYRDVNWLKD